MRSEQEMLDMVLGFARGDERVRAVIMNGSRANPGAPKDKFQDYDLVFVVRELLSFTRNHEWIGVFGKRLILQMPELMRYPTGDGSFSYLILFEDCSRMDLTLIPLEKPDLLDRDSQSILLLDKDGIIPPFPPASDADYFIRKPSELFYASCCNNFWWCLQNVAKGIARDELPYTMLMFHNVVREELHDMISWYIGVKTGFTVSAGKMGKYFKKYLPAEFYEMYERTYSGSNYEHIWDAVFSAAALFRGIAPELARKLGFSYNSLDDKNMMKYLYKVKSNEL